MKTPRKPKPFSLQPHCKRRVQAGFDGGRPTSDGGVVLLREVEMRFGIIRRFVGCFTDRRDQGRVEHGLSTLVSQRVMGLACGYEDVNDHDEIRRDPALALVCGVGDIEGKRRRRERDRGVPLAGKSTLNRLEDCSGRAASGHAYHKISLDFEAVHRMFVENFMSRHATPPEEIVIDVDATDMPLHGRQEGRHFHGYYKCHCYLPMFLFCGERLLAARLRTSDRGAASGLVEVPERVVPQLRSRWPATRIVLRGDGAFSNDDVMSWCEAEGVDFVFGMARNDRLARRLEPSMARARRRFEESGEAERVYCDFEYRTLYSWSRSRRLVGKAECLPRGPNPRYVVTSVEAGRRPARELYERGYCPRGDAENRIKEQLMMYADRVSATLMRSNQIRLFFSAVAYTMLQTLRQYGLAGTADARAQCDTIRLRYLKLATRVVAGVRRIRLYHCDSCPWVSAYAAALRNLKRYPLLL